MSFRTRVKVSLVAFPLLISPSQGAAQNLDRTTTFHTSTHMVLVPFTVTDNNGKTIEGLQATNFSILDDQKSQQIMSFSYEDRPSSVGLVMDISGSMTSSMNAVKYAAKDFVRVANPEDQFLLLTVSTSPAAAPDFTNVSEDLQDSITYIQPGGFTALIDTVYWGLNRMRKAPHPQRALVVLSDGVDNHSRYSKSELLRIALEADVQVYSVIVDNGAANQSGNGVPYVPAMVMKPGDMAAARERSGTNLLEELANKTGGLYFHVHTAAEAKDATTKAGKAIRNQYVIGYEPKEDTLSGKWHRVQVKTTVPKVHVHARTGYYAP